MVAAARRRCGYHVVGAGDPSDALELAGSLEQLDFILADLMLPEMNGSRLAAEVRKLWPDVQVSFMSGYSDADMVRRGILSPLDPFLQKPFSLPALTSHVRAVLQGIPCATARPRWPALSATVA
jgi:CheY-like chemotaxis protein